MASKTKVPSQQNTFFAIGGDILNYFSLLMNVALTSAAMMKLPHPSWYDPWWTNHGFCVNQDPDRSVPTELLCFVYLAASALMVQILLMRPDVSSLLPSLTDNPQLQAKVKGSVFANAAHGGGHLFLMFLPGPPPGLEFKLEAAAIANIIMLVAFWYFVLKNIMVSITNSRVFMAMSIAILTIQYFVLHVPDELSFTYSQSVILFLAAVDQLLLKEKGFTYFANAMVYAPVLFLYTLEMTNCQQLFFTTSDSSGITLSMMIGGHSYYDLYLGMLPFLLYGAVHMHDQSHSTLKKKLN